MNLSCGYQVLCSYEDRGQRKGERCYVRASKGPSKRRPPGQPLAVKLQRRKEATVFLKTFGITPVRQSIKYMVCTLRR